MGLRTAEASASDPRTIARWLNSRKGRGASDGDCATDRQEQPGPQHFAQIATVTPSSATEHRCDGWIPLAADPTVLPSPPGRGPQQPTPWAAAATQAQDLAGLFASIGLDRNYGGIDLEAVQPDRQGWASNSPCFADLIAELRPSLVIEVGSWKGASLLEMARISQRLGLETTFICVDTWLGSNAELWLHEAPRASLKLQAGYPTLFLTFLRNLRDADLLQQVFPMPMTSLTAALILRHWQVQADLVYVDAGHTLVEVETDLELYSKVLRPGGVLLGDDYLPEWPGVIAAADGFGRRHGLVLEQRQEKFLFRMPT